jgi:alkanesulfonate monooxygenase SsuD/methylene tetrahydromethanopterin reductase-like flavin-dependent oxidoreductase (luciferase family)
MTVRIGLHVRLASRTFGDWSKLYAGCLEQAEAAEAYGFDSIVVAEHHFQEDGYIPSPYIVLGGIAARTKRLRLGAGVRPLPMIHPIRAAEDIAVLDNLSNGRALGGGFGLGGRAREYQGFGIPWKERRRRYEEGLPLVDRLLTEENVHHEGRFYRIDGVTVTPRCVQKPRPPIWIAASVEPAIRRAAQLGDVWFSRPVESLAGLKELTTIYQDAMQACGKDWKSAEHVIRRDGWVADDDETAWKEALPALHFHYTRDYAFFPSDATMEYMRDYGEERFIVGSPETIIQKIKRYEAELGVTLMIIALDNPGLEPSAVLRAIRTFGEKIIPYI